MKTQKVKNVLIALDYDPTAQKVADQGYELAKLMGAEVYLLHIITDLPVYTAVYPYMEPWIFETTDDMNNSSRNYLEKVKRHLKDEKVHIIQKEGSFDDVILDTAKEIKADIIVMGTHSRSGIDSILLGSVTKDVLKKTNIPLFIIPTRKV